MTVTPKTECVAERDASGRVVKWIVNSLAGEKDNVPAKDDDGFTIGQEAIYRFSANGDINYKRTDDPNAQWETMTMAEYLAEYRKSWETQQIKAANGKALVHLQVDADGNIFELVPWSIDDLEQVLAIANSNLQKVKNQGERVCLGMRYLSVANLNAVVAAM